MKGLNAREERMQWEAVHTKPCGWGLLLGDFYVWKEQDKNVTLLCDSFLRSATREASLAK